MSEAKTQATPLDAEIEKKIALYMELRKAASEFEKVKKELRDLFKGTEKARFGRFLVTGSLQARPEKTTAAYTFWDWKVKEVLDTAVLTASQEA